MPCLKGCIFPLSSFLFPVKTIYLKCCLLSTSFIVATEKLVPGRDRNGIVFCVLFIVVLFSSGSGKAIQYLNPICASKFVYAEDSSSGVNFKALLKCL